MIRISSKANPNGRSPWRRRISNQLAAFAAIMLLASTQVGTSDKGLDFASDKSQVAAEGVLSDIRTPSLELTATLDQAAGEKSKKKSGSSKESSLKLNLFRFRR